MLTLADIQQAQDRIRGAVIRTPLLPYTQTEIDQQLFFKPENFGGEVALVGNTMPIIGASKMYQLEEALSALDVKLSDDDIKAAVHTASGVRY